MSDSGSQVLIINEGILQELIRNGIRFETLPVQSTVLLSACGNKTTLIRKEVSMSFAINGDACSQVISGLILGSDLLFNYGFAVDFEKRCLNKKMTASETGVRNYEFAKEDTFEGGDKTTEESGDEIYAFQVVPITTDNGSLISNMSVETEASSHDLQVSTEIQDCQQVDTAKRA